jgi:hypothetical protein
MTGDSLQGEAVRTEVKTEEILVLLKAIADSNRALYKLALKNSSSL